MTVRRRKKKNKLRGQRTHGKGNTKNKRGAGCRGGRGRAGSHKHKYSKYYADFGKGIKLKSKLQVKAINLVDLVQKLPKMVEKKLVEKDKEMFVIDGKKIGFDKILGKGFVKEKILVKNMFVSKNAEKKIIEAGGKIEKLETSMRVKERTEEKTIAKKENLQPKVKEVMGADKK